MPSNKSTKICHPNGWTNNSHYCHIGGQCGQSCPCCRAELYLKGIDTDAYYGACSICIVNNNHNNYK